jgi:MMPL family
MLVATVALSFAASLGVSSLFFNHVFDYGNADNSFPLFVFVFLVALGIDYNIFLMTRVREETHQHGPRRGALTGLSATGGAITSAAPCWPARSPRLARCRSRSWPNWASRSRSACCSTPAWSGPCWSRR